MKIEPLTKKEQEIMDVLWNSEESMSTNDIKLAAPELVSCTIQQIVQKLLKKKYIEISGIGYTKNVLTRKYSPIFSQAEYLRSLATEKSCLQFVTSYIEDSNSAETLHTLENMIKKRFKEIEE